MARPSLVPLVPTRAPKGPPVILGCEEVVDTMRARAQLIDLLTAAQAEDRALLMRRVDAERNGAKRVDVVAGGAPVDVATLLPSVIVTDPEPVPVSQVDSFAGVPLANVGALRSALGSHYGDLFETTESVKLRKGTTCAAIHAAIGGDAFAALSSLLDVTREVTPRKGWDEARAKLRPALPADVNEGLDTFEATHRSEPKIRLR